MALEGTGTNTQALSNASGDVATTSGPELRGTAENLSSLQTNGGDLRRANAETTALNGRLESGSLRSINQDQLTNAVGFNATGANPTVTTITAQQNAGSQATSRAVQRAAATLTPGGD